MSGRVMLSLSVKGPPGLHVWISQEMATRTLRSILSRLRGALLESLTKLWPGASSWLRLTVHPRGALEADVRSYPVLCFGDSITEGYHNIWPHPTNAPGRRNFPEDGSAWHAHEHSRLLLKPYAIHLGYLLAADVGDCDSGYSASLRYARARGFSGWTAEELLPELRRSLREGAWRCAVIMAGVNDVLRDGVVDVPTLLARIEQLFRACDEAGVRVVALTPLECDMANHGWVAPRTWRRVKSVVAHACCVRSRTCASGRVAYASTCAQRFRCARRTLTMLSTRRPQSGAPRSLRPALGDARLLHVKVKPNADGITERPRLERLRSSSGSVHVWRLSTETTHTAPQNTRARTAAST